jgi:serine/threonine protein kinase
MALPPGSFVGPFEVVGLLGAGGMGEVYRVKDRRLKRDVAVKILPAEVNKNPEWARRFESEARAASAINHPNILAVYDLGTHEGAPFVVCELLEGETLRAKLEQGPIPPRKAFEYARQIAEGLAAAHDKGIVHRDLKPENLFITADGRIKILDFGLAKLQADVPSERPEGQERTLLQHTQPGAVMGTPGYMSPEQVRGENVDHRSDIFSVGAILYEMFTGKRAFQGASSVETMSAVLQTEPPEPSSISPALVAGLDQVIAHCLEKSPTQRFQTARDMAFALHALTMTGSAPALRVPRRPARQWPRVAVVGIVLAGAVGVGFVSGRNASNTTAETAPLCANISAPVVSPPPSYRRLTYRHGNVANARFGSDGRSVYLDAVWGEDHTQWAVHMVTPDSPETRLLDLKSEARLLGISSKGEMAVLRHLQGVRLNIRGTLARLPIGSNAPRDVQENVYWADWLPGGDSLIVVREGEMKRRIELPGGRVIAETSGHYSHLRVSPAGNRISFIEHPAVSDDRGQMVIVDMEGKQVLHSRMFGSAWGAAWAPSGELWFTASVANEGRSLRALSADGTDRVLATVPSFMTLEDIATDGRVLILKNDELWGAYAFSRSEKRERELSWFDRSLVNGISADGSTILMVEGAEAGGAAYRTYLRRTDGSDAVFLGSGLGAGRAHWDRRPHRSFGHVRGAVPGVDARRQRGLVRRTRAGAAAASVSPEARRRAAPDLDA